MDRLQTLSVFAKVVESGSFSAAAEKLGLSRAAASKQVLQLEEHLGTRLLNRTTRRLSLTEEGGAFYERAVQLEPHNPDLLLQLAAAQLRLTQINAARDTLLQASTLAPDRADIHLLLGLALSKSTPPDPVGAAREWERVQQLAPGSDLARQAEALLAGSSPSSSGSASPGTPGSGSS